jgi:ketosteroid isomerase-like protein
VSEQEVSIVRRIFEAWATTDPDPAFELLHADIEWTPCQDEPETATLHGHQEIQGLFLKWLTAFDDLRLEPSEFIDAGDAVVIPMTIRAKLKGSGVEVTNAETMVFWLRDGKVAVVREYRTRDEALEAAGLSPSGT